MVKGIRKTTKGYFTVKIRLGWTKGTIVSKEVLKILQEEGVDWVTIHGRTRDQLYKGAADWEHIGELASIFKIPIIGNGDINSREDAIEKFEKYKIKGIAIGRGSIGKPWLFKTITDKNFTINNSEKLKIIYEHIDRATEYYDHPRGIIKITVHIMKYIKDDPGSRETRARLSRERNIDTVKRILKEHFLKTEQNNFEPIKDVI